MKITKEQVKALAYKAHNRIKTSWKTARDKYVEDNRNSIASQVEKTVKLLNDNPCIWTMRCKVVDDLTLSFEKGTSIKDVIKNYEVTRHFENRFEKQYPFIKQEDVETEIMIATIKAENLETLQGMLDSKFNTDYATFNMDYTTEGL